MVSLRRLYYCGPPLDVTGNTRLPHLKGRPRHAQMGRASLLWCRELHTVLNEWNVETKRCMGSSVHPVMVGRGVLVYAHGRVERSAYLIWRYSPCVRDVTRPLGGI